MTTNYNNDENKFLLVILACAIMMMGSLMFAGCKSSSVADRHYSSKTDSVAVKSYASDSVASVAEITDSTLRKHSVSDSVYAGHYEVNDAYNNIYKDHVLRVKDSVAVSIDSVTGNITLRYYTDRYECDIMHDTIYRSTIIRDTLWMSRNESDSLKQMHHQMDSMTHYYWRMDSAYRAMCDSLIDTHSEVTVKEPSLWQRIKDAWWTLIVGAVAGILVLWYMKGKHNNINR